MPKIQIDYAEIGKALDHEFKGLNIKVTRRTLAFAIMDVVMGELGLGADFDDAGLDWRTDGNGRTIIFEEAGPISEDPNIAALVDAANILHIGNRLHYEGSPMGPTQAAIDEGIATLKAELSSEAMAEALEKRSIIAGGPFPGDNFEDEVTE